MQFDAKSSFGRLGAALMLAASALVLAAPAQAAPPTLTSLSYVHVAIPNCENTVDDAQCSPVGVTAAGATANPFLNDTTTKTINLGFGHYYTFGNPFAGTDFMVQGDSIIAIITLSDGRTLTSSTIVPDLSVAGATLFSFAGTGIDIVTTGITDADRMSFGLGPSAFAPDGRNDYVLQLDFVPEPAAWALMVLGFGVIGATLRRRPALAA